MFHATEKCFIQLNNYKNVKIPPSIKTNPENQIFESRTFVAIAMTMAMKLKPYNVALYVFHLEICFDICHTSL